MVTTVEHCVGKLPVAEEVYIEDAYHKSGHGLLGGVDFINAANEATIGFARDGKIKRVAYRRHY